MHFHEVHRFCSESSRSDGLTLWGHHFAHRRVVHVDLLVKGTPEVAIGKYAEDQVIGVHYHCHAESLAGHLDQTRTELLVCRDARKIRACPHDVFHVKEQLPSEASSWVR